MKKSWMTLAAAALIAAPAYAEDAQGNWSGTIAGALNVIAKITMVDGRWDCTLVVPQQNFTTKVDNLVVTPEQISFALTRLNASYAARWNEQEKAWVGTWTQGQAAPLILKRADEKTLAAMSPKRPQEAAIKAAPLPYKETEVSFANEAAQANLVGTLTTPAGTGPFPTVVLVHGSGPLNRDEELLGHKPFLILADHLARQGIAVLRYDKRGNGKSTGNYKTATSMDFAADAEAAVNYLRSRTDVDARHIGLLGHSEGGLIAPIVAARDPKLGFVVMMAGPGVRGEVLLVEQIALMAKAGGKPDADIARERSLNTAVFAALTSEKKLEDANKKAAAVLDEAERKGTLPAGMGASMLKQFNSPWFHQFLGYEPGPALQALRQPILVLNGELDLQVPAKLDLDAIRIALKANARAEIKEFPKLNHLFQTAKTGSGAEYAVIEETIAPLALNTISTWIRATVQ